jgi:ubiquinone/menaquinone biosynthesis C-methylase UbiE
MKKPLLIIGSLAALTAGIGIGWRQLSRRRTAPFPAWMSWMLTIPHVEFGAGSARILDRLGLEPGMRVLDVGCGPGRVSIPAAQRVGPSGEVVALDMQEAMLKKLERRAAARGVTNIRTVHCLIGAGALERDAFDCALLVAVLGEIPDRAAALREICAALKPGGVLSITEGLPDPHYQRRDTVVQLAEAAGLRLDQEFGGWTAYTANFVKPQAER